MDLNNCLDEQPRFLGITQSFEDLARADLRKPRWL